MTYDALHRGRYSAAGYIYHVTTVTAGRNPVFADLKAARMVIDELRCTDNEGATHTLAYVLMPDHLHWLFQLRVKTTLSSVMHRFKGRSARRVNRCRHASGALWQRAFHDHAIRRGEDLRATARYIVANPLRAGMVTDIGCYPHWDAIWLGDTGEVW